LPNLRDIFFSTISLKKKSLLFQNISKKKLKKTKKKNKKSKKNFPLFL